MKTNMVEKLRALLAKTTQEEFDKDWSEIEELGLEGPSIEDFISSFYTTPTFSCVNDNNNFIEGSEISKLLNVHLAGENTFALAA